MTIYTYAICSLAEAKDWINIPVATMTFDALVTDLINVVTDWLEQPGKLNRRVKQRTPAEAEVFDGDGQYIRYVKNPPMVQPTVITIEGEPAITVADTNQVRYDLEAGKVMLLGRVFSRGYPNNCSITYQGGWATVPTPLWQGARELVKRLYKQRDRQNEGVASISSSLTGQTVTYRPDEVMDKELWNKYFEAYVLRRYV